jgi:glycosyltransferase involved in cell wall biosynthesis
MKLSFLLPGDNYSGGVRVTMQMGNCLLERGHDVRIAHRTGRRFSRRWFRTLATTAKLRSCGIRPTRWLSCFKGKTEPFVGLNDLRFEDGEILIAVGADAIGELSGLDRNTLKLRYCHGLVEQGPDQMRKVWGGPMPTIVVSPGLLPRLEEYCQGPILGIVPNGICHNEYFVENRMRDGIGLIFSQHPIKGPEVAAALVRALAEKFPQIPRYIFGACRRANAFASCEYTRYPSIAQAREIYNRTKIWLVTSRDEGFCLPMLEAMACGCAVITSRHTNAADLIQDGVNGFTVPYGDVAGYLNLIERLLVDEPLRQRIVQEGFKTVSRLTWKYAANRMEEILFKFESFNNILPTNKA